MTTYLTHQCRIARVVLVAFCTLLTTLYGSAAMLPAPTESAPVAVAPPQNELELTVTRVAAAGNAIVIEIAEGTPIVLTANEFITSKTAAVGDKVAFIVTEDVKGPNGEILIVSGTKAVGTVQQAEAANFLGIPGQLHITIDSTTAKDNTRVPLTCALSAKGKDNMVVSIAGGIVLCILLFLIKGGDATIGNGRTATAKTSALIRVTVQR